MTAVGSGDAPAAPRAVLFVCTGNICRSPTAEGVLRALAGRAGLAQRLAIDSCGTHGYHVGEPSDERSIAHAARRGYDLSGLRARQLSRQDFDRFDLLVGLDRGHARILAQRAPTGRGGRVRLLLDYAAGLRGRDVPDPYYGGPEGFELALDLIERGCRGLLDHMLNGGSP